MNSINLKLAHNLKTLLKTLDIKQGIFAERVGITASYVSSIVKGKTTNVSDQVFNSVELKYGVNKKILTKGSSEDVKAAIKKTKVYFNRGENGFKVAQPEVDYKKHGGWTPQSEETDWGCLNKVVKIIDSDTIYSKALLQNIDAFYQAVMAGNNRRKSDRRKQDVNYDGENRRKEERRQKKTGT